VGSPEWGVPSGESLDDDDESFLLGETKANVRDQSSLAITAGTHFVLPCVSRPNVCLATRAFLAA
jgi:hypothetical protein